MPMQIVDLDDGLGVLIKGTGTLTSEEYFNTIYTHLSKPEQVLKKYIYTISDYHEVEHFQINMVNLHKIAMQSIKLAKINKHVLVTIITGNDRLFSLAKMWVALARATSWNIKTFRDRESADNWMKKKLADKHDITKLKFDTALGDH